VLDRMHDIELAVGAGDHDDADARAHRYEVSSWWISTVNASITGLASRRWHISST
jgi:hypothetical protein